LSCSYVTIVSELFYGFALNIKIMKLLRYILPLTVCFLFLAHAAISQTSVSDTKLLGLKGQVKSMVEYGEAVSGYAEWVLKEKTRHKDHSFFDKDGNLTETINEQIQTKYLYSKVDGFKTFRTVKLGEPKDSGLRVAPIVEPKPIEPNEKLTEPDKRFEYRYVYEAAKSGTILIEREFDNRGKLWRKRTYEYNKEGVLTKKIQEDTGRVTTSVFTYDGKGNVVEIHESDKLKVPGSDSEERITYTDVKYDSVGNWTERKATRYIQTEGIPNTNIKPEKYTLVNLQYRSFTYY